MNIIAQVMGISDTNLIIPDNQTIIYETTPQGVCQIIVGVLDYTPPACYKCGIKNDNHQVIKNDFVWQDICIPDLYAHESVLRLQKRRFKCHECHSTFMATTSFVDTKRSISKDLFNRIAVMLTFNHSRKDIADACHVSDTTVKRVLQSVSPADKHLNKKWLPKVICMDKFRVGKNMAMICTDGDTNDIIEILPYRHFDRLKAHFMQYPLKARRKVRFLVSDMNYTYAKLIKDVFPNAQIITDRYHVVQLLNRHLNILRTVVMNKFRRTDNKKYRRLKRYWKLLLKSSDELNYEHVTYNRSFQRQMNQQWIVDELLTYSTELRTAYRYVQDLRTLLDTQDSEGFLTELHNIPDCFTQEFKTSLRRLRNNKEGLMNAMTHPYSNGPLEGLINKIKTIKRVAYGYRNFIHFKQRIFIIQKGLHN